MLQALVNVWWLFAAGFSLGGVMVLCSMSNSKPNPANHWTKNASNFFGDLAALVIGVVAMFVCGILLIICGIGALV